jgi:hypothetical protein
MKKIPFVSMFSQSAMGLSICGNDLIITVVCKKLVKYSHETFKIKDFMLKDVQQLKHALLQRGNFVGEIILSLPRELSIVREIDYPHSNLKELREALLVMKMFILIFIHYLSTDTIRKFSLLR